MAGQCQTCDLRPPAFNKHPMTSPTHPSLLQCPIREPNYLKCVTEKGRLFSCCQLAACNFRSGYLADGKFLPFFGSVEWEGGVGGGGGVICLSRAESVFIREGAVSVPFRLHPQTKWAGFRNSLKPDPSSSSVRVMSLYWFHAHFFPLFFMVPSHNEMISLLMMFCY